MSSPINTLQSSSEKEECPPPPPSTPASTTSTTSKTNSNSPKQQEKKKGGGLGGHSIPGNPVTSLAVEIRKDDGCNNTNNDPNSEFQEIGLNSPQNTPVNTQLNIEKAGTLSGKKKTDLIAVKDKLTLDSVGRQLAEQSIGNDDNNSSSSSSSPMQRSPLNNTPAKNRLAAQSFTLNEEEPDTEIREGSIDMSQPENPSSPNNQSSSPSSSSVSGTPDRSTSSSTQAKSVTATPQNSMVQPTPQNTPSFSSLKQGYIDPTISYAADLRANPIGTLKQTFPNQSEMIDNIGSKGNATSERVSQLTTNTYATAAGLVAMGLEQTEAVKTNALERTSALKSNLTENYNAGLETVEGLKNRTAENVEFVKAKTAENVEFVKTNAIESVENMKAKTAENVELVQRRASEAALQAQVKAVEIKQVATDYLTSLAEHLQVSAVKPLTSSVGQIISTLESYPFVSNITKVGTGGVSEAYQSFKNQPGVNEVTLPAREEWKQTFVVQPHKLLFYEFVVKDLDVAMGINLRTQADGGSSEEPIVDTKKYEWNSIHKGSINAGDFEKVFVFCIGNTYSLLRSKTVLYRLSVVDPAANGIAEKEGEGAPEVETTAVTTGEEVAE